MSDWTKHSEGTYSRTIGKIDKGVIIYGIDHSIQYGVLLITNKGTLYANEDKVFVPIPTQ